MVIDPNALKQITGALAGGQNARRSDIGACFNLALIAAAKGDDAKAGAYLREVVTAMEASVNLGGSDAHAGHDSPGP